MNLEELAKKIEKTGDSTLDMVRLLFALAGGDVSDVKIVPVEKMPEHLYQQLLGSIALKACYHNTLETMEALGRKERKSARYVLGYWDHPFPIEHCFLRIGDTYHDPTREKFFDGDEGRHFSVIELSYEQLEATTRFLMEKYRFRDHIGIHDYQRYLREKGNKKSKKVSKQYRGNNNFGFM